MNHKNFYILAIAGFVLASITIFLAIQTYLYNDTRQDYFTKDDQNTLWLTGEVYKLPGDLLNPAQKDGKKNNNTVFQDESMTATSGRPTEITQNSSTLPGAEINKTNIVEQKSENLHPENAFPPETPKKITSINPVSSSPILSEEEIFQRIWSDDYIKYLQEIDRLIIEDGFPADGNDPQTILATDKDIFKFLRSMFIYTYKKGWITDNDLNNFLNGVEEILPELIKQERDALQNKGTLGNFLPNNQYLTQRKQLFWKFAKGILNIAINVQPIYAGWTRNEDCYKDDDPNNQKIGSNKAVFCCNCGLHHHGDHWHFHNDCGPYGVACDRQLGCLNRVCGAWPNAIWDRQTGICGCG